MARNPSARYHSCGELKVRVERRVELRLRDFAGSGALAAASAHCRIADLDGSRDPRLRVLGRIEVGKGIRIRADEVRAQEEFKR